jgi:two-component system chemotaxis sensor kinase CheA
MDDPEESKETKATPLKPPKPFRSEPAPGNETTTGSATIRIETSKLDSLFLQAEEMVSVKLTMRQCASDLEQIMSMFEVWKKRWARIHPESSALRRSLQRAAETNGASPQTGRWMLLLDFLQWNDEQIKSIVNASAQVSGKVDRERRALGGMVDSLLEEMKKVLMMPFSSLLGAFPKLIRDLSHDLGKKVELVTEGMEIEIDRRILEQLKDPLIHLVRNSIDHGVETADNRLNTGKPTTAKLRIVISQADSNKVEVCISDDGSGIDVLGAAKRRSSARAPKVGRFATCTTPPPSTTPQTSSASSAASASTERDSRA